MKPKYLNPKFRNANLGTTLVTVITVCFGTSAFALDNFWTGAVSTDWNNAGNWSDPHAFGSNHVPSNAAGHPGDEDAIINATSPANYPVVVATPSATPRDVKVGRGAGTVGRVDHSSGTVSTGSGNWMAIGLDGGNGTYNLALPAGTGGTLTGMGQSAGSINANGSLYVPITAGSTGTFNLHTTGTVAVSNLLAVGDGGTGTFKMDSGTITTGGEFWVGQGATGNGTFSMSAGQVTIGSWVAVGRDGGTGVANISGGTMTKNNGGTAFIVGASGPGTFNHTGGTVNVAAGDTWIGENSKGIYNLSGATTELSGTVVQVGRNGGATDSELNLNGGTLRLARLIGGGGTNEKVTFNGTQVIAKSDQPAFMDAIDIATIGAGGFKIDSNGKNITSAQIIGGSGGITKTGAGTFTLTGGQTYTGVTAINAGKFVSGSSAVVRGNFTVANGATFGTITSLQDEQLIIGTLTMGTGAPGTAMDFNVGNFPGNASPGFEALKVNGAMTLAGNVTINVADQMPVVGQIPLIKYTPGLRSGAGTFVLGTLPLGVGGTLVDDQTNGVVYLNVTSVALPRWDGAVNGNWDFVTQNWFDLVTSLPSLYTDNTPVLFNDDPAESSSKAINLGAGIDVKPSQITINNSTYAYTFSGPGKISGPTTLTKSGTAALTISNTNEYTGATTFSEGPVSIASLANGGSPSSIGSSGAASSNFVIGASAVTYTGPSVVTNRGFTIGGTGGVIDTANNIEFQGLIATSAGNLTKTGAGNLTFSNAGANVFGTVNQGLKANGGTITFTGGGTQTNTVAGELWIGSVPDVPAHVVLNGGTLNVGSWIALGRGNGNTGVTSSLTATNSTIQSVNFSTGFANGLPNDADQTVALTNTTWTNGGATLLAESINSTTNMTVGGASVYNATASNEGGRFHTALGENSVANLTVSGTSQMSFKGRFQIAHGLNSSSTVTIENNAGIVKAGEWTSIGNSSNGTGTLNVKDNGTFTTNGDFNISDVDTSTGIINLSGNGTVTSTGTTFVGKNGAEAGGTTGTINQSGGTFNCSNWITVGRFRYSNGTVNVSGGTFNQTSNDQAIIIGEEGTGTLNVTSTGAVNITGTPGLMVSNNATGVGTVNLDGGTITTKRVQAGAAGAGVANFNFDGGTLTAGAGANADFFTGMDTAVIEDGGATINSNGNTIGFNQTLTGDGGFTKTGAGTLLMNGSADNTGANVVSAGTLGGIGSIAGNITVNSGASINPGAPLGVLTASGTTTFATGSSLTIDLDASPDMLAAVNLVLNNTALVLNGTPTQPVYLLARYGSRSGTFSTAPPAGYAYNYNYISDGFSHIALVQTGGSPYTTWINGFFPGETNPAIIGEAADPDKDGSSNALEFALGGAPNSGTNNAKVYSLQADGSVDGDTNKELLLTIAVRNGTPAFSPPTGGSPTATHEGFTYTVQGSLDLSGFATTVTVVAPVPPASNPTAPTGYEYRTFSLDGSNNLTGKGFLRARVTKVP